MTSKRVDIFVPLVLTLVTSSVIGADLAYATLSSHIAYPPANGINGENVTTKCINMGTDSESESTAKLLSDGNNVTQQCEQSINSVGGGSQSASNQYKDSDKSRNNQVNQQVEQNIGN